MEEHATLIETLLEKTETYTKSGVDLLKLKVIDRSADILSVFVAKLILIIVILLAIAFVNIGLSIWISTLIGNSYSGFFIVAVFYIFIALIMYYFREPLVSTPINNSIIKQMLKGKKI